MEMPRGTVTLLFSDIEESTRLWERAPEQMAVALERHDRLVRVAIESSGGWIFKTVGDGFCASFSTPEAALTAAATTQRAIAAEPWGEATPVRVRIAIHTGACQERDGDYFGPPVNRVARLEAVAHGGQVVVSRATVELVGDSLSAGLSLRPLGQHRLKDLERPEEVFQLDIEEMGAMEFPPLRSLPEVRHNLPLQLTSFIGRAAEMATLAQLFDEQARLVTLIGPGGCGKTRLALQVAAELMDHDRAGVWFVDLSPLRDDRYVVGAIAAALPMAEEPDRDLRDAVASFIGDRPLLIVMDNCEHVIDECAKLVDHLLRACPSLAVLATSREPLGIGGEQLFRVPSLSVPEVDPSGATPGRLLDLESVQLLVQRVHQHDPSFEVDDVVAPAIASICRRLDGIPLAIELVAARMTMMSPAEIDRRLDDRFRLLTGGSRSAVPRQQTLQASMDWSYDLLTPAQRAVLCRTSVFVGSFDLEAAEAVCPGPGVDALEVVELVSTLVDRSLLRSEPTTASRRFGLSESVRQYAARRLGEDGDAAVTDAEDRLARHFAARASRLDLPAANTLAPVTLADERARLDEVFVNGGNVLAALRHAHRREATDDVLRLAYCVSELCWHERRIQEGIDHLTEALDVAGDGDAALGAQVRFELGTFLVAQGRLADGRRRLEEARAGALGAGRLDLAARVDHRLAFAELRAGDGAEHHAIADCVAMAEGSGDPDLLAYARYLRGSMSVAASPSSNLVDLRAAAAHFEARGMERCYWDCVADLGFAELDAGNLAEAKQHLEGVLSSDVGLEDAYRDSTHLNLAEVCLQLGEIDAATRHWQAAATPVAQAKKVTYFVPTILIAALCCTAAGHPIEAAQLHGAATQLASDLEEEIEPFEAGLQRADVEHLSDALGSEVLERETSSGTQMTFEEAVAIATLALAP